MLDIDNFKNYNDTYGHQMGDSTLQQISKLLNDALSRDDDYCFRLGGEEFGGVVKTTSIRTTIEYVNKLKQSIEDLQIEHSTNTCSPYVTASFGLIFRDVTGSGDSDEYYKLADDLLYKAKAGGRNLVVTDL